MRNRVGIVLVLSFSSLALSGCLMNTAGGPCYGFGCGSMASAPAGAPQSGAYNENAAVASNNAPADDNKNADVKQHGAKAFFKNLLPSQHTGVAPATVAPPAATAGN
ncbi:MAG TPA: hypothetical protein VMU43_09035 [Candidatus Acidoferrum sp.]|nr:hypothetical protein [Candidatus Acidoferrum sp.]